MSEAKVNMHGAHGAEGSGGVSRRGFLKGAALAAAAGACGAPVLRALSATAASPLAPQGEWRPATCQGCTSWCSKEVYVVNGRGVKIRGNARSKVNGSASCPKAHLALQQVYDPDRIKTPMKRTNPNKGRNEDPKFVPITWDEAIETIADKLMELRAANETHKYMLIRGRYTNLNAVLYDRMTKILGSPNNISHSSICAEAEKFGPYYTEGIWGYRQYDILNTRYILCWGADPLSSNRAVSASLRDWGDVLDRAKVAVVEPRLSATAAKADEWLPVIPGGDGAAAVAMAHVILTEGLWFREFVGDFTDGENRFKLGQWVDPESFEEKYTHGLVTWWNMELKDKTPEWAEPLCGIPAEQIRRVAVEFASAAPHVMSWVGGGPCMQVRGAYASMACHALNGLVGACDNVGGALAYSKSFNQGIPDPKEYYDDAAKVGLKNEKIDQRGRLELPSLNGGKSGGGVVTNNTADGILNSDPYDIKVCIAYWNNFPFSSPQGERWERALTKIPFLAHITTNASEFSWFADILLPDTHSMMERWGFVNVSAGGWGHCTLMQPIVDRVWDYKADETEIPWLIAEKLAAKGFDYLQRYFIEQIKDPETGKSPTNEQEFSLYCTKLMTQNYWDPAKYKGGDRFNGWEDFCKAGVWNSDPYKFRARWGTMKTKTGMFEFYSETLKEALASHAEKHGVSIDRVLEVCKYQARGDMAFLPHYEEPYVLGDPNEYPFVLVDYKSRLNREGRSANCSWYHELKDLDPGDEQYQDVAKFNPAEGRRLGLKDGDRIRLTSPVGSIECTAKLWEGVRPGTISKCYGLGHWAYGRLASKVFGKTLLGGNNNDLIPADYDRLSGASVFYGLARLKVEKIRG